MRPYSFSKPKIRRLRGLGSSIGVDTEYQQALSSTTEGTSRRMLKKFVSKPAGESKPEAYPQGRTVRRIRSTTFVRAAEW